MMKGNQKSIKNVTFKVLDVRKKGKKSDEVEIDVEVKKDNERGVAALKIFGPSKKKGCTIMMTKLKKYDAKFAEILAFDVIKDLLDNFHVEDGWINFFVADSDILGKKSHFCHFCNKGYANEKNLKNHITKFHKIVIKYTCDKCDFSANRINELEQHEETLHGKRSEATMDEVMEVDSKENKGSEGNKRKNLVSNSPVFSPPPKRVQLLSSFQLDDASKADNNEIDDGTPLEKSEDVSEKKINELTDTILKMTLD